MTVLLAFAFLSGVVTILSPCILPVLPIVLSGGVGGGKARPLGVVLGFVASFAVFTLTLTAIVQALRIPPDALRIAAVVIIALLGLVMLVPGLTRWFERLAARAAGGAAGSGGRQRQGFVGGLLVGLGIGLIWTPCVGPIMASVISLALTQRVDGGAVAITIAYTLGTAIPMLGVMLGGRALLDRVPGLKRHAAAIQKGFGALMIAMAVVIGLGWDRRFQAAVLTAFPGYGAGLTSLEATRPVRGALAERAPAPNAMMAMTGAVKTFKAPAEEPVSGALSDYGSAPELVAKGPWLNTGAGAPALNLAGLRGKVVMVDFWTYSCVNCIRTLPWLRSWYAAYRDKGLVIVGVHSPEFEFEKSTANVERAARDLRVTWPVVQDNDYAQWTAYGNQYWPAHYFIDARGRVRYFHYGEGGYADTEKVIQALLREAGASVSGAVSGPEQTLEARTPETYLGSDRSGGLVSTPGPALGTDADYTPVRAPGNGEWSLEGRWTVEPQYAKARGTGTLRLGFDARSVFLVIEPEQAGGSVKVFVDDALAPDTPDVKAGVLSPVESRMYQLVALPNAGPHVLRLVVTGRLRLFAFTFG
jgi:cytochrome c biogenesis protein CcdA/thiol-disulfide isomerase/thioredoxin